jgi:hypothetical protein
LKVLELKKSSAGAIKATNTVSNNGDAFKKLGEALTKHIVALEKK